MSCSGRSQSTRNHETSALKHTRVIRLIVCKKKKNPNKHYCIGKDGHLQDLKKKEKKLCLYHCARPLFYVVAGWKTSHGL